MKRFRVLFLMMVCLLGFGLLLISCDNGTTSSGGGGVVGTWVGQHVEEGILFIFTIVFRPDFTFTMTMFAPAVGMTIEDSGTFSVTGNTVTFTYIGGINHGLTDTAIVTGNTMIYEGIYILTRQ